MSGQDVRLVDEALRGEREACEALYRAHAGRVGAYFRRSGFARADADDLTQETFLRAFRSLATFDPQRGAFGGWLSAIARNVARRRWGRRSEPENFDPDLAEHVLASTDNPGADAAAAEELSALRACIETLPEELSRVVRLRYVEGRTTRGIASATTIPESTVRLRLAEAHEKLLRCLRSKGVLE